MPEQILKPSQETNYMKYDPAEMVQQLGKSLGQNGNQQQREGLRLLEHAAAFSARVKEVEGLQFSPIENNFKVYSEWAVVNQAKDIGTMAVDQSTHPTNVYYVVSKKRLCGELTICVDFRVGMEIISDVWRCHRSTACGQYRKSRENSEDTGTTRVQASPLSRSLQSQWPVLWVGLRFARPSKGPLGSKVVNGRCFEKSETKEPVDPHPGV
jgi:hypothetical protein